VRAGRADVLITGGGTAGHIYPALAVAEALVANGHDKSSIQFVGARRGLERELVPPTGFTLTLLPGRGLVRRLRPVNLLAIAGLLAAFPLALAIVAHRRPQVVVAVGGYGGLACSIAAFVCRIPVITVNVDAVAGAANRLVSRFGAAAAVPHPGSPLPRAVVTGVPVRAAVRQADRSSEGRLQARRAFGFDESSFVLAVVGGSLGARRLNEAAVGLAPLLTGRHDVVIYHVSGSRDYEELRAGPGGARANGQVPPASEIGAAYRLIRFEERLPELFVAADLVLSRAGAMTVAELRAIGTPAILVPLPGAPADHQRANAQALASTGAALLLEDRDASAARVAELVLELLTDRVRLAAMTGAARTMAEPDAADAIAKLIDAVATRAHDHRPDPGPAGR
jgi:UDP-N-acetylglucosamine--N-acetylmuramyl-(pentapeptide) pyrophosphoryl-undecaprenol N-acetylglucosamine transferase